LVSEKSHDWLGSGVYFWEGDPIRAFQWACLPWRNIETPSVIGAVIDLGRCLDLTTQEGIEAVKSAYEGLAQIHATTEQPLPQNAGSEKGKRNLDCAVIKHLHRAPLDTFNRNADKVGMAACAQLVNNLNALFLTHGDKFITTPNFNVFELYAAHQGATAVRAEFAAPEVRYHRDGKPASFWGLKGSASIKGKTLTLTAVNPDVSQPREAEIVLRGASAASAKAWVVSDSDIHAHNTFEAPERVKTRTADVALRQSSLGFTFSPASVTKIEVQLS
jgi:Alpha-L-arabinofuranosidase C-terminal domain